jgi:hypothetical protein
MPQAIPKGLTRAAVLQALADLDAGVEHPFGPSTGYELVHEGRRYSPKAVVGLACRSLLGRVLQPEDFSGGQSSGQANAVLRGLGFVVEAKHKSPLLSGAEEERGRREVMWRRLLDAGGPAHVTPPLLREIGIYGGAQGVWVDKVRTGAVTPGGGGVTVGVLHTGRSYADDLADDCIIYHYPKTKRFRARDEAEVVATKAAGRLNLPVFVITYPTPNSSLRDVRRGWVEDWDDETTIFLISFEEPPEGAGGGPGGDDDPFDLVDLGPKRSRLATARTGQQRFKFRVFQRYGPRCAVCDVGVPELLDAAHLRPKEEDGSDDPRNGLVFCPTHHRAFDRGLFAIEPSTLRLAFRDVGPDAERLGIRIRTIEHLKRTPHSDALRWLWKQWTGDKPTGP